MLFSGAKCKTSIYKLDCLLPKLNYDMFISFCDSPMDFLIILG